MLERDSKLLPIPGQSVDNNNIITKLKMENYKLKISKNILSLLSFQSL